MERKAVSPVQSPGFVKAHFNSVSILTNVAGFGNFSVSMPATSNNWVHLLNTHVHAENLKATLVNIIIV